MNQNSRHSVAVQLLLFSFPLILSGILQQLYSWADAFIVGHAEGELQLAAIGATSSLSTLLINMLLGFTLGLSLMSAQCFGRGDLTSVRRITKSFLPLLCLVYTGLALAMIAFAEPILRIMDTPAEIFGYSLQYLQIVLAGVPFLACYNLIAAQLRAAGNTKAAFYSVLLSSALNVALDILFIVVFRLGVGGAAIATVISQIAMTLFVLIYAVRRHPEILPRKEDPLLDRSILKKGFSFALPPAMQNSVTAFGNLVLQNFMNSFGASTVLAITTAYRVDSIMLLPIINLGAAVSSMVARGKGAQDDDRIKSCFKAGLILMIAVSASLSLVMFFFGAKFIALFGVTGEALETGKIFFRDLSIFYTLFGVGMVLRSFLEGIGDITCSSLIGIASLGTRILFSYLLRPIFGGRTIAIAEGISWILLLVAVILRVAYKHRQKSGTADPNRN